MLSALLTLYPIFSTGSLLLKRMGAFYDERSVLRLRQEYEHVYNFTTLNRPRHFEHTNEVYPEYNFYIEPRQVQEFGENLLKRRFVLYDGHRQSGKSTFCQAVLRWFAEHPNKFLEITGSPVEDFEVYPVTFDSNIVINQTSQVQCVYSSQFDAGNNEYARNRAI
ncbi:hypothetical protein BDF19DRAFT_443920 [Syncephalis fuscata]|nr:hypothetical protein BDF19DRAFT_443920 [Syncephalis fuscata]